MSTTPDSSGSFPHFERVDLDELFQDAPVLKTPHDLAAPWLIPDDTEFEEFLASVRADRDRDLA